MTAGQRLVEQGIQQGIRQGIPQGIRRALLSQLRLKFGDVPADVTARVEAGEVAALERWTERVLTATTLDDIFADP